MKLKKITLENIRSYKTGEFTFSEGSTLLSGDIGSGKTTILLGIAFALFGLQPGQKGSSLLASSENSGTIKLELEIQNQEIIIERKLKRTTKSVTQETPILSINGRTQEISITELKAKVLSLLNYPLEFLKKTNILYNYTVYSPQEQMKQIILEDPESRLNVLRHIFGIDKYKKIRENLLIVTSKLRERSRILQFEIRDLEECKTSLNSQKEFIRLLNEKQIEKIKELSDKIRKRKSLEDDLKELREKISEKQKFEKEIEKTQLALTYKSQEISKISKIIFELNEKIKRTPNFDNKLLEEAKSHLSEKRERIDYLNSKIIDLSSKINSLNLKEKEDLEKKNRLFKIDLCPTCLQDVPDSHKHNILNETESQLVETKKRLLELTGENNKTLSIFDTEKSSLTELESKISALEISKLKHSDLINFKENLESLEKQKKSLNQDSFLLEKHEYLLKKSVLEFSRYDNLFNIKESELKIAFQKEKNVEIEIAEIKKELELLNEKILNLNGEIKEKELSKDKLSKVLEIEQWLSTMFTNLILFTEKNILLKLRNEFSKYFNKWFSMLTSESFYANLDETFTPIINQGEFELDYSFLSGGERTAVALAYRLALNQIINSLFSKLNTKDLVILDEPTDGFSSQQLDKIRDILQELDIAQLIIVSHEQKIESFVDNIIKIKKENGFSKIST